MSRIPPYRYGSPEVRALNRLDEIQANAPAEFDTLSEVAAELQELRNEIAALQSSSSEISLLLLE